MSKNKKNITIFHLKSIIFTAVENRSILHGRVFEMKILGRVIMMHISVQLRYHALQFTTVTIRHFLTKIVILFQFLLKI